MTARYLVTTAQGENPREDPDRIAGMNRVFCSGHFRVWSDGPAISLGKRGVIVGHLFTRTLPSRRVTHIEQAEYEKLERSSFRSLVRDYWGGYVAIFVTDSGELATFRDPSGAMPCFFGSIEQDVWLSSDAGFANADGLTSSVNYLELARFLWSPDAMGTATCLAGEHELIAGQCLTTDGRRFGIVCWWSPWDFAEPSGSSPPAEAPRQLRETAVDCIRAWAECFSSIVIGVSGGLDSSIVAASLPSAGDVRCLTMIGPDAEGDESGYARILTDALSLPLREARYDLARVDITRATLPHLPWPIARPFAQNIDAVHACLNGERAVDAYFTGSGGDNVFCSIRSATPVVDRFLAQGFGLGLWQTLIDICDLTDASLLTVLHAAWHKYRRGGRSYRVVPEPLGLSVSIREEITRTGERHPWLSARQGALPGKAAHIAMLMRAQKGLELHPRPGHALQISPLLSQPLVELCLAIPTWQWIQSGMDRACARQAFSNLLPAALIRRTSKGGPGGFMRQVYTHNADTVMSMLRNGVLMREAIIDPAYLDEPIPPDWQGIAKTQRLLSLCAAESWARSWENAGPGPVR